MTLSKTMFEYYLWRINKYHTECFKCHSNYFKRQKSSKWSKTFFNGLVLRISVLWHFPKLDLDFISWRIVKWYSSDLVHLLILLIDKNSPIEVEVGPPCWRQALNPNHSVSKMAIDLFDNWLLIVFAIVVAWHDA